MSEPQNPLFEEEKEFLERKKLEYERALRGDVEHIREQGVQVGKVALAGAGVVGGIWLLSKLLGRRKRKQHFAGDDYDEREYQGQGDNDDRQDDSDGFSDGSDAGRYLDDRPDDDYAQGRNRGVASYDDDDDEEEQYSPRNLVDNDPDDPDDNGLHDFPDFPAHSDRGHGSDDLRGPAGSYHAPGTETDANDARQNRPFWHEEHSHPSANLPYDDSRRLSATSIFNSFADAGIEEEAASYVHSRKKSWVGPALSSFLQSETGRVLSAQVVTVALALVTKAVKDLMPADAAETLKNADLAPSTAAGAQAPGQPALRAVLQSPVSDAHDPDTDAPTYHSLA